MASPTPHLREKTAAFKIIFVVLLLKLLVLGGLFYVEMRQLYAPGTTSSGSAAGTMDDVIAFGAGVFLCATIVLIVSYIYISGHHNKLNRLNSDLMIINQSFANAEALAGMGHWRRNMHDPEKIYYSSHTYRLFGLEPEAEPFTVQRLLTFVHPEDRQRVAHVLSQVWDTRKEFVNTYRIIRPDGKVRHLKTLGKFMTQGGDPILIGSTRDVTDEVEGQLAIEKKNRELESLVEELASFNHIASHDLQNPLRKIQMFVSRIQATEDSISQEGIDYFNRIAAAAEQMERLIDDLLLYSETGNAGKGFEKATMSQLLDEALADLGAEITAANATIHATPLPDLEVIPFQVRQLFTNIISNAIKYSKKGEQPVITISSEIEAAAHKPGFACIAISDNGIGFSQENACRIFELFQRLHKKGVYEGTGIGLAICKKIMENHNGYISAQSTPGSGAVFYLYFPKHQAGVL